MQKNYVIDTNVFLDNPNVITILRNGIENNIYIPKTVLMELDKLKSDTRVNHLVTRATREIEKNLDFIKIIENDKIDNNDLQILEDIKNSSVENPILVTNDRIFRLLASDKGIKAEEFLESLPFKSESEIHTGILKDTKNNPDEIANYFTIIDGLPILHKKNHEPKLLDYKNEIWKLVPKSINNKTGEYDIYQNMAMELLLDNDIKIVSIQSQAGAGKSTLALAAALENVLLKKKYKRILVFKPLVESGEELGFLKGTLAEKMHPYISYVDSLLEKLNELKDCRRIYKSKKGSDIKEFDEKIFKFVPLSFIRGLDIEDSFVIIDEAQGYDRNAMRTILTRMGKNCKVVILGDTMQVDNTSLNPLNNGMNWQLKYLKKEKIYAHIVLQGKFSRGEICDAVLRQGL